MNLQSLENNTIIIVPKQLKEKVLIYLNSGQKLINLKIMSLDEFKRKYYFDYTTESIYFLMSKYHFPYDFSLDIINNLYYINFNNYGIQKLDFLVKVKKDLVDNNLLIFDTLFKMNIQKYKIYVYGFSYIDNFFKKMLENLNIQIINPSKNNYNHSVYEFETIDDEITFLANQICELIETGTEINKIKIIKPSSEYITVIKRIFKMFNLPFNLDNNYLISTNIVNKFFKFLDSDITKTLNELEATLDKNDELVLLEYNQIVKICNKYNWCDDFKEIKNILIEEFKRTKINLKNYEQRIEFVELQNNCFEDDEIIFLIGFNQNNYPKISKDDDFLNDELKSLLNLETTLDKNIIAYNTTLDNIKNIKNLTISYKLKTPFNTYYKSQIIEEKNLQIIKVPHSKIHYSTLSDKLSLASKIDTYLKYGVESNDLKILLNTFPNINYKSYNNQYTKINNDSFRNYLKNNLTLSYSSIDNFYRCGFRYYIENILKLNINDNDFTLFIGNLFHYVLSLIYNHNFNFDDSFNNYVKNNYKFTSYKEKFFVQKLKEELKFIIGIIKEQNQYTTLDNHLLEEIVKIDLSNDDYHIIFKGIIDKIMYKTNNDETLIAIIDYKTGHPNLNLNNIIYGLDMQLMIYAYLSSKIKKFKNPRLVGIYLQKILNKEINIDSKKNYITLKKENLKLQGYSTQDESILKQFDNSYESSNFIKGLKVSSKGFYAYSKVFDKDMLQSLLKIVEKNIYKARDKILNREFSINPKKIGIKNLIGCEYCKYKELCFMTDDDIVNLKEYKNLEFLGGDNNEMD